MLKKLVSLILTAMIISSLSAVTPVGAASVFDLFIDFEDTSVNADSYFSTKFLNSERYAVSGGEVEAPDSLGSYILKIAPGDKSTLRNDITISDSDISEGIIEYKMDTYYDNTLTESEYETGIGVRLLNADDVARTLWRINAWTSKQLTLYSDNNININYTETDFTDETWYTFKTVINLSEGYFELHYKESGEADVSQNYKKAEFSNGDTKLAYRTEGENYSPNRIAIYNHAATKKTQYVDNIGIKIYADPVAAIKSASDAAQIKAVLADLESMGLFDSANGELLCDNYDEAILSLSSADISSVGEIQTAYNNIISQNKESYIIEAVSLNDLEGGRWIKSDGELFYQVNGNSTAALSNPMNSIMELSFDTKVATSANAAYDIYLSGNENYNSNGRLMGLVKQNKFCSKNGGWTQTTMISDNTRTNIRLILNADKEPEELIGYVKAAGAEQRIKFSVSDPTQASAVYRDKYIYNGETTSGGSSPNGGFIDNPGYIGFNPVTGNDAAVTFNYIYDLTAVVYEPLHTAVNGADDAAELEKIIKKYAGLGEITLNPDADYSKIYTAINQSGKVYEDAAAVQQDYDLLCTDADIKADITDNTLQLSFINDVNLSQSVIVIAMYNKGALSNIVIPDFIKASYLALSKMTVRLENPVSKDSYDKIKLFIWSDTNSELKPLTRSTNIK